MGRVQPGGVPRVGTDAQADRIGTAPAVAGAALPAAGSGVGGGPLWFVCTNSGFGLCKEQGEMERAMAKRFQASSDNVRDYWRLFVTRRAYVVQSPRPHPESGRHYYFRPKTGKKVQPVSLSAAVFRAHRS